LTDEEEAERLAAENFAAIWRRSRAPAPTDRWSGAIRHCACQEQTITCTVCSWRYCELCAPDNGTCPACHHKRTQREDDEV